MSAKAKADIGPRTLELLNFEKEGYEYGRR